MVIRFLLPILAAAGVVLAVYTVLAQNRVQAPAPPVVEPAAAPYRSYVAGAGLVEASTENIAIGTHVAGVVAEVFVRAGDAVEAGRPLFRVDDRTLRAEVATREAALRIARAELSRLEALPRVETVPPAEAKVRETEAQLADARRLLEIVEKVGDPRAVSAEESSRRRFAVLSAEARLAQAQADLTLLKAGAWAPELEAARAQVQSAQAQLDAVKTDLERMTVTAPVDATILKVNVRPGEFAAAGTAGDPLVMLGNTDVLHVRVDVDENDAWRVKAGAPAKAFVRGNPALSTDMAFVRFEPWVVPKRSLTGASTERVDTRVLQVLYRFDPRHAGEGTEQHRGGLPVYVGQQMDVFIEAPPASGVRVHNPSAPLGSESSNGN